MPPSSPSRHAPRHGAAIAGRRYHPGVFATRRFAVVSAFLVLVACGSGNETETANSTVADSAAPTTTSARSSPANTTGCRVTLADVQALLPANSGVTENRTPDATRCNFTWNDNGPRGIHVARVPGGRAAFEQQSSKVPNGPTTLKDGTAYETLTGLGERAWAFGDARQANVVVLRGGDLYAVDLVIDGTAPAGSRSPTGMDTKSLEICQALAEKALG